jgi:hypothetical protein
VPKSAQPVRAVFVDNSADDLKIANRLNAMGLPCERLVAPPTIDTLLLNLRGQVRGPGFCLILLDYRLDDDQEMSTNRATYRGGTVAAALKEEMPDSPVVLMTTQEKRETWLVPNPRVRGLFDFEVLKEQLTRPKTRQAVVRDLLDLGHGFQLIARNQVGASHSRGWGAVAAALGLKRDEAMLLPAVLGAGPPTGVTQIANFVLHSLMHYPGLLLDARESAARLGISHDSFMRVAVHSEFRSAKYEGVFSEIGERWWRGRLEQALHHLHGATSNSGDRSRVEAIQSGTEITEIRLGHCTWCEGIEIDRTCQVCRGAADPWHRLVATVESWPTWAELPVVCFECIYNGRADDAQFSPNLAGFVESIKSGGVTRQVLHG